MKAWFRLIPVVLVIVTAGCSVDEGTKSIDIFPINYDFSQSDYAWQHGFSQYPVSPNDTGYFELKFAYTTQPAGEKALMISGNNRSNGLFMFLKKKVPGLKADAEYTLTFNITLTADAPQGLTQSQAENVFLKVGASAIEPKSVLDSNTYVMNIDIGDQQDDGRDMINIGNLTSANTSYSSIIRTNASSTRNPLVVKTDSTGDLWLCVGTDSAFEGVTTLYYSKISVVLSASK